MIISRERTISILDPDPNPPRDPGKIMWIKRGRRARVIDPNLPDSLEPWVEDEIPIWVDDGQITGGDPGPQDPPDWKNWGSRPHDVSQYVEVQDWTNDPWERWNEFLKRYRQIIVPPRDASDVKIHNSLPDILSDREKFLFTLIRGAILDGKSGLDILNDLFDLFGVVFPLVGEIKGLADFLTRVFSTLHSYETRFKNKNDEILKHMYNVINALVAEYLMQMYIYLKATMILFLVGDKLDPFEKFALMSLQESALKKMRGLSKEIYDKLTAAGLWVGKR